MIFFRDQDISHRRAYCILHKIGDHLENHAYVKGLDKHPEIVRIIKTKDEKKSVG